MASEDASKSRQKANDAHETIQRPWTNPNRADAPPLSNRSRIRDIQRRLRLEASRANKVVDTHIHEERRQKEARLPADKQRDYERELVELLREDAIREAEKRRNAIMKRYKKVKFIESRKAERRWRAAQRALKDCQHSARIEALRQDLHIAEVDRNYVKYCPLGWTYVSLYASKDKDDPEADGRPNKGDPEMWQRIEQAMSSNSGLDRVKNELVISVRTLDERHKKDDKRGDDDDSDGGFFE